MTCIVHAPGRDLSSFELWEASLSRSRHRRRLAEDVRKRRTRLRAQSVAASAAMLGPTAAPGLAAAAVPVDDDDVAADTTVGQAATGAPLVAFGAQGPTVAAVQAKLRPTLPAILVDGIFGPQTQGAVRAFQRAHGLAVTGWVDAKTWSALFRAGVVFYDGRSASERQAESGTAAKVRFAVAGARSYAPDDPPGPEPKASASRSELADAAADLSSDASGDVEPLGADPAPDRGTADRGLSDAGPEPKASSGASAPVSAPAPAHAGSAGGPCSSGRMVAPVRGALLTGNFGEARPGHRHAGLDLAAPSGTAIRAAQCGEVSFAGVQGGYGNLVCIKHAGGVTTCYAHLSRFGTSLGRYVHAGDVIGYVGCTGSCTGPHVHFEVRRGSSAVDPKPWLSGAQRVAAGGASTRSASVSARTAPSRASTADGSTSARRASVSVAVDRVDEGGAASYGARLAASSGGAAPVAETVATASSSSAYDVAATGAAEEAAATPAAASTATVPAATPAPVATPTPTPVATPAPVATPTPTPAPVATATPTPAPVTTPTPAPTPVATTTTTAATSAPTTTATTTATPAATATPTPMPTPTTTTTTTTPTPAPTPVATPAPAPEATPAPAESTPAPTTPTSTAATASTGSSPTTTSASSASSSDGASEAAAPAAPAQTTPAPAAPVESSTSSAAPSTSAAPVEDAGS